TAVAVVGDAVIAGAGRAATPGPRLYGGALGASLAARPAPAGAGVPGVTRLAAIGGRLYAVLDDASLLASDDSGATWRYDLSPSARGPAGERDGAALRGVAYGGEPGLYVAVGQWGTIVTSPDGAVWTSRAAGPVNETWNAVAWGGGAFVAVGEGGRALRSTDGLAWAPVTTGVNANAHLLGVTYGDGAFVAVGWQIGATDLEATLLKSPDGVTWQKADGRGLGVIAAAAWAEDVARYTVVGASGRVATSDDGVIWLPRDPGTTASLADVTSNGTTFVAIGGETLLRSQDGVYWSPLPTALPGGAAVRWGGGEYAAAGDGVATSVDAIKWVRRLTTDVRLTAIAWGEAAGQVAVGQWKSVALER
ncbi:MAG: hypothetical protein KC635_09055, partial [Myxococcales bacterium]|nr:hypothetical protein [Myxococcales bacterium]